MKFTYYFEKIAGVSVYPIFSLLLFVVFFILVTFWALKVDRNTITHAENLPLENDSQKKQA